MDDSKKTTARDERDAPPPFRKVRFFNKTKKPATSVNVHVETADGTEVQVVADATVAKHKLREIDTDVWMARKVKATFTVDSQNFSTGGYEPSAGLKDMEELHIDLHWDEAAGKYRAIYSARHRGDNADAMEDRFLLLEAHP